MLSSLPSYTNLGFPQVASHGARNCSLSCAVLRQSIDREPVSFKLRCTHSARKHNCSASRGSGSSVKMLHKPARFWMLTWFDEYGQAAPMRRSRPVHAGKPQQVLDYFRCARTLTHHISKLGTVETASCSSGPAFSDVSTVALSSKRHKV